jgi:hypothetical protein
VKLLAVATATLVLALTGCSSGAPAATPTSAAASTPAAVAAATVPNLDGMTGQEAKTALETAGLVPVLDGGDDTVLIASNWDATGQDPAPGEEVDAGSTVTVTVKKKAGPTETPAPAESAGAAGDVTTAGLDVYTAQRACDAQANAQFPYGYDPHWILGKLAEENRGDTWFLKVEADITNAYDAERAANVECVVGGTKDAPQVTEFNAY